MIFDTDIIIWFEKGNLKAAELIEKQSERFISVLSYMELLQCALSKKQITLVKQFLHDYQFITLPLTENIGHRAAIYIEQHVGKDGLRAADAIIAATAIENNLQLSSSNQKHYKVLKELKLAVFKP